MIGSFKTRGWAGDPSGESSGYFACSPGIQNTLAQGGRVVEPPDS